MENPRNCQAASQPATSPLSVIGVGGLPTNKIIEKRWDAFVLDEAVNHRQSELTSGTGKKGVVCRVPDLIAPEPQTQLFPEFGSFHSRIGI